MSSRPLTNVTQLPSRRAAKDLEAYEAIKQRQTDAGRQRQRLREVLMTHLQQQIDSYSLSPSAAAESLIEAVNKRQAPSHVLAAAKALARGSNACPSRASLISWVGQYQRKGVSALRDGYKPRERTYYGWEARALELFNVPNRPDYSTVAHWLQREGYASALYHRVRYYLKSVPATLGREGIARQGAKRWHGKDTPHVIRDATVLDVGFIFEGDGHTCDVYVQHPLTGNPFRPELTPWIDVRSRYVVSWMLTEAESGVTTLMSLARGVAEYDHVPALIHVDPGSGFRAKMITDEVSGFLARLDISVCEALPGNWRGKGLTEGWFRWFEEREGKRWQTFCGHCRTDEQLSRLQDKIKRGQMVLPTLAEYEAGIAEYIEIYNNTPQRNLSGRTPAELWAELQPVRSHIAPIDLIRQRETRKARGGRVMLFNRYYTAHELLMFKGKPVIVEFDLHDMSKVTIRDLKGRWICDAPQDGGQPWLPTSRIDELRQKRLAGQVKRLELKQQEAEARARTFIDTTVVDRHAELAEKGTAQIDKPNRPGLVIDPYKTDY